MDGLGRFKIRLEPFGSVIIHSIMLSGPVQLYATVQEIMSQHGIVHDSFRNNQFMGWLE